MIKVKTLIILAEGFEDIEAFTVIDVLHRAGVDVTKAGISSKIVTSMHGVKVMIDKTLSEISSSNFDMLVLPGGLGHRNLLNSGVVLNIIKEFNRDKKIIGAICAAPIVLAAAGVLDDKIACVYPGLESKIPKVRDAKVIASGNIITSKGPGTAIEFALMLVERSIGKKESLKIREQIIA